MTERFVQGAAASELQRELRDLLCLAGGGDHVRWALTGDETTELAEWPADAVAQWRAWAVAGWARHRRSQAIDADIAQLLDAVCAGLEAQVRAREDVALVDAARDRLNENAAVRAERLRRSRRLP